MKETGPKSGTPVPGDTAPVGAPDDRGTRNAEIMESQSMKMDVEMEDNEASKLSSESFTGYRSVLGCFYH